MNIEYANELAYKFHKGQPRIDDIKLSGNKKYPIKIQN